MPRPWISVFALLVVVVNSGCSVSMSRARTVTVRSTVGASSLQSVVVSEGSNDVNIAPESAAPAVSKSVRVDLDPMAFDRIFIDLPVNSIPVHRVSSRDGRVHLGATIVAATERQIDEFFQSTTREQRERDLLVHVGPQSYACGLYNEGSGLRVSGVCIQSVSFAIPEGSTARVYFNDIPGDPTEVMTAPMLRQALSRASLDQDRRIAVERYFATRLENERLTSTETAYIVGSLTSDEERFQLLSSIAPRFSGLDHVISVVRAFRSDHYRSRGLDALVSGALPCETISISEFLEVLRSFDDDFHRGAACDTLAPRLSSRLAAVHVPERVFDSPHYAERCVQHLR